MKVYEKINGKEQTNPKKTINKHAHDRCHFLSMQANITAEKQISHLLANKISEDLFPNNYQIALKCYSECTVKPPFQPMALKPWISTTLR